ncbi:MAG: 2Fe-2S iron-sulfur cluster-binding protein [bacterium]
MAKVTLTIDGKRIEAESGEKILWVALDNGIYIPHLCAGRGEKEPVECCRLCYVEVEGRSEPAISCGEAICDGMVVRTKTHAAGLVRAAFDLLMSAHPVNCSECPGDACCALQEIAAEMKFDLTPKRFPEILPDYPIDDSHPDFFFDANRCVHCGKCVRECNEEVGAEAIDFIYRGIRTKVGAFGDGPIAGSRCVSCFRCVEVCPVKAFYFKSSRSLATDSNSNVNP